jgi:hypothetical protein
MEKNGEKWRKMVGTIFAKPLKPCSFESFGSLFHSQNPALLTQIRHY